MLTQPQLAESAPLEPPPPPAPPGWQVPPLRDPRWTFASILTLYAVLGCTILHFNRDPGQILLTVAAGCLLDVGLARLLKGHRLVPLSGYISSLSLAILLNYSHNYYLLFFPVVMTIGSKYILTFRGRHIYNPSLFGVATSIFFTNDLITPAPAYQWGGGLAISVFVAMLAVSLFMHRIGRTPLIVSFLGFYVLQVVYRAYFTDLPLAPQVLLLGSLTSAPFFIFTFYMITDPATSPRTARGQVAFAAALVLIDLALHRAENLYTFYYAAFILATAKLLGLHLWAMRQAGIGPYLRATLLGRHWLRSVAAVACLLLAMVGAYRYVLHPQPQVERLGFELAWQSPARTGIRNAITGELLELVDPQVQHIRKWLFALGDAVGVGDYDGDGRVDLFFSHPMAPPAERLILYRNLGDFRFQRVAVPALDTVARDPRRYGEVAGGLFVDDDNDGDLDLFLFTIHGSGPDAHPRLLRNRLRETSRADFADTGPASGIGEHAMSISATFFDYDRDGRLDLLVGNTAAPLLVDYDPPRQMDGFRLPLPAYAGDRRMFNFMTNDFSGGSNGGRNHLYHNEGGRYRLADAVAMGMPDTRWTLSISAGDINRDGWDDLYVANDFGPDDLYMNLQGRGFQRIQGRMFGFMGLDVYKGMNSSMADVDRNGYLDIYISNVHEALHAEGSMLWMTYPGKYAILPNFRDEATLRGALNERGWGWGAAMDDVNDDGWVDIVQVNGMFDCRLERPAPATCPEWWYINHKLIQSPPGIRSHADMWGDMRGRSIYPNEPRRLYLSRGDRQRMQFAEVGEQVGIGARETSRGAAFVDLDNDGDLDLVIANQFVQPSLYRNNLHQQPNPPGWLGLGLTGGVGACNRQAVGTMVEITYPEGGKTARQIRQVQVTNGFAAQPDPRLHFGLGHYHGTVTASISWCGQEPRRYRLQADRYHAIDQRETRP